MVATPLTGRAKLAAYAAMLLGVIATFVTAYHFAKTGFNWSHAAPHCPPPRLLRATQRSLPLPPPLTNRNPLCASAVRLRRQTTGADAHIFSWHPTLMVAAWMGASVQAALTYRVWALPHETAKAVHGAWHVLTLILFSIALAAVVKQHNDNGLQNFYSLHSWFGLATIATFGLNVGHKPPPALLCSSTSATAHSPHVAVPRCRLSCSSLLASTPSCTRRLRRRRVAPSCPATR